MASAVNIDGTSVAADAQRDARLDQRHRRHRRTQPGEKPNTGRRRHVGIASQMPAPQCLET
jgi:hypothetical protein